MLSYLSTHPHLRCTAKSRRSGWQQCGRVAAYGSRVCRSHGARKMPRFGVDAPNYKHGRRSAKYIEKCKERRELLKVLALGVEVLNGS